MIAWLLLILNIFTREYTAPVAETMQGNNETQVMAGDRVYFNRQSYQDSIAFLRAELTPSQPVIKGFIGEVMQLDDLTDKWGLKHSKRLKIANNVYRKAGMETRWGEHPRSKTARKCNNHFGTKLNPRITPRANEHGRLRMAKYERWTDAYIDVIEFHIRYGRLW